MGLCLAAVSCAAGAQPACPAHVHVGIIDYELRPLLYGVGKTGIATGPLVDAVRSSIANSGCKTTMDLRPMPIRRGRQELKQGGIDIWAVALVDQDLLNSAALPLLDDALDPQLGYFRSSYSIYVLKDEHRVSWDGKALSGPPGMTVGISPVNAVEALAHEKGWAIDKAIDTPNALSKLLSGRHVAVVLPDPAVAGQPEETRKLLRRLEPALLQPWYYAPVNRAFAQRYPEFTRRFWLEMCRAVRSPEAGPCRGGSKP